MRRARGRSPVLLLPGAPIAFPNPEDADDEGMLAIGGDLSPERLLHAYEHGVFPWYDEGLPPLWWSPNPRAIIERTGLHVSRSLRRVLAKETFRVTFDQDFEQTMRECGRRESGTWILPEMIEAYVALYRMGHAHSFEVWQDGELAGGLYGVQRGALFAAESMFHRRTDASKVALVYAVRSLFAAGMELFDVQLLTNHLESMGAVEVPRADYLVRARAASEKKVDLTKLVLRWDEARGDGCGGESKATSVT
jgi:leucyl/phenylalanyl-tRNA--protein transferase